MVPETSKSNSKIELRDSIRAAEKPVGRYEIIYNIRLAFSRQKVIRILS